MKNSHNHCSVAIVQATTTLVIVLNDQLQISMISWETDLPSKLILTEDLYSINQKRELIRMVANGKTTTEISLIFSQRNLTNISSVPQKSISLSLLTKIHFPTKLQSVKKYPTRLIRLYKMAAVKLSNTLISLKKSKTETLLIIVKWRLSFSQTPELLISMILAKTYNFQVILKVRRMAITTQHQGRRDTLRIRVIRVVKMTQTTYSKALRNRRLRR